MSQQAPPPPPGAQLPSRRTAAAAGGGVVAGILILLAFYGAHSAAIGTPATITASPTAAIPTAATAIPAPVIAAPTPTLLPATPTATQTVCEPRPAGGYAQGGPPPQGGGLLPDPFCTPGEIIPAVTPAQLCVAGYAHSVRNVPYAEKLAVYHAYGITTRHPGEYEVDHLISLELGGDNAEANLWPQPALPIPGFHEKDLVENWLHAQVCAGAMPLADAQKLIATNWLTAYQEMTQATPTP